MPPLRPLQPATQGFRRFNPDDTGSKSQRVSSACQNCRNHKSKCDGVRPTCGACTRRNTACQYTRTEARRIRQRYTEARKRESIYEELIELLKTVPSQDAAEIVRQIRCGTDVASIVSLARDGNLLLQLSLAPSSHRFYEFPHMSSFPQHLLSVNNPYLNSALLNATSFLIDLNTSVKKDNGGRGTIAKRPIINSGFDFKDSNVQYGVPYHAAQMVEPTIEGISTGPWTCIISDNHLLRRLVQSYFLYPHPCGPFVHKDLFLHDMAAQRTQFCSPLLVNAMLAFASQSYFDVPEQSSMWLPGSLTYRFVSEARRLWDLEASRESCITTIQAALILSFLNANNSMDEIGTAYLERALSMGKTLDLFGVNKAEHSADMQKARIFTAWAIFSWQAMFDYYFFRPPHLDRPPQNLLPDPGQETQWYGEIWLQYPHSRTPTPSYLRYKIYAESYLHVLMNEIGLLSFGNHCSRSLTLHEIIALKRRLDDWRDALPQPLQAERLVYPMHFSLHVEYYTLTMALMRLVSPDVMNLPIPITGSTEKTPLSIIHDSEIFLETIMRLYYMRHSFEVCDSWVAFAMTVIGNMAVKNLALAPDNSSIRDGHRSTLILSAKAFKSQASHYYNARHLALQLQSVSNPRDLQLTQTYVTSFKESSEDHELIGQYLRGGWPLPIISLNENPDKARLNDLVKAYEKHRLESNDKQNSKLNPAQK